MAYIPLTYTIEKNEKNFWVEDFELSILLIFKSLGDTLNSEIKE